MPRKMQAQTAAAMQNADHQAIEAIEALQKLHARPEKTIKVMFSSDTEFVQFTGQIRIGDGCMIVYRDLPGGDFLTIAGIPLSSIEFWEEIPEPEAGDQDASG